MIYRSRDAKAVEMVPGLLRRTLVEGRSMMICECTFESGVEVPTHSHAHEQAGYVVSGVIRLTIDDQRFDLGPRDSYYVPANVPHSALSLEPCVVIDTFSPPREDYRAS